MLECTHGLQIDQTLDILDLRYAEGRIIVKAFPGALLFLLCAKNINLQVLTITLNLAVKKLVALLPIGGPFHAAAAAAPVQRRNRPATAASSGCASAILPTGTPARASTPSA